MNLELLGSLVNEDHVVGLGSGGLGDDLDGYDLAGIEILGLEDHAEGAMVKRGDGFISSIEHNTLVKLVAHTIHRRRSRTIVGKDQRGRKGRPDGAEER
jgi:hypothetical protein